MRFYFFRGAEVTYAAEFRRFAINQNAVTTRFVACIVAVCSGFSVFFRQSLNFGQFITNLAEYSVVHNFIFSSSIVCFIALLFAKRLPYQPRMIVYKATSLVYALCIMGGFMALSFVAQHNPANTVTMFMIGLVMVAVLWTLTALQTILYSLLMYLAFIVGLRFFQLDAARIMPNQIVGFLTVLMFFIISRISFSYHYNHFVQLKNIIAQNDEIAAINKTQNEILAIVAHDLRSPVNNIIGLVNLVKDPMTTENEKDEMYGMILNACQETDVIIHDLIDVVRKTHEEQLVLSEIGINDFINTIQQQWVHRVPENHRLLFNAHKDNVKVSLHPQKIHRVFDNLISNAIKFTGSGGIITVQATQSGDQAIISVSDDGMGIPAALQPYIFDRFSRAGRPGRNGEKSYGLGLSICKQIVEAHHGSISVHSTEGQGTTFTIYLPCSN